MLLGTVTVQWAGATEQEASTSQRLDRPTTEDNSHLADFGYNQILRVPNLLGDPAYIAKNPKGLFKGEVLVMAFHYPSMVVGGGSSPMDMIFQKEAGTYKPQMDDFPVNVLWLFYSEGEQGNLDIDMPFRDPRPARIFINVHCFMKVNGGCYDRMWTLPSGIDNINSLYSADWLADHPDKMKHVLADGGSYVATPEAPYELSMDCSTYEGVGCTAYVYDKKTQRQFSPREI